MGLAYLNTSMEYRPLEAYGVVGNLETCALVGPEGSVDWLCLPRLASPSVFARLLDLDEGGWFDVRPVEDFEATHDYLRDSAVLRTTFRTAEGKATLTDAMPLSGVEYDDTVPERALLRRVSCREGEITLSVGFHPRLDYGRAATRITDDDEGYVVEDAEGRPARLRLTTDADLSVDGGDATGTVTLSRGDSLWFVLSDDASRSPSPTVCERTLARTVTSWREWLDRSATLDNEPYREMLARSALTIRLLTNRETGAIAAAPTTSLPEDVGGVRNWDYRFHWLRDSSIVARALARLGYTDEAYANVRWWLSHLRDNGPAEEGMLFRPLYDLQEIDGTVEVELNHLAGYRDSDPVRIGNAARDQHQHDIYGELLLTVAELVRRGVALTPEDWVSIERVVDHVCEVWDEPDFGIWEVRSAAEHFVNSKVMCWAALDRGIDLAHHMGIEPPERWKRTREEIHETVLEEGYNEETGAFVRSFEANRALDAACLRIPQVGFLPADDERVQGTIDAVLDRLVVDDGLVQRYEGPDGLPGEDHAFILCTFWLVDALALAGREGAAHRTLRAIIDRASSLGLFAEEIDPMTGQHRGNYPLAFAHAGLINSVLRLWSVDDGVDAEADVLGREIPRVE